MNEPDRPQLYRQKMKVGVVGVCASGKSTLVKKLSASGYDARHIAQEHSYVKDMWKRISHPDTLIFLDVTYEMTCIRRSTDWTEKDYNEQQRRLLHARDHANIIIDTTDISADEVFATTIKHLKDMEKDIFRAV
jgi:hypothetical protein